MYRMVFRFRGCDGCKLCEIACSLKNYGECKPSASVIKILDGGITGTPIPAVTRHCACSPSEASCLKLCRRQAISLVEVSQAGPAIENSSWVECPMLPMR